MYWVVPTRYSNQQTLTSKHHSADNNQQIPFSRYILTKCESDNFGCDEVDPVISAEATNSYSVQIGGRYVQNLLFTAESADINKSGDL